MASPYTHPVQAIDDISRFFKQNDDFSLTFIGETLELRIPSKFAQYGVLTIGDSVTTPGVMDMIFDDKFQSGLNLTAAITIEQSDIGAMTYKAIDYLVLKLKTGDKFMSSVRVLQDPHIVYVLWSEFITAGKVPYFFGYDSLLRLFEHARELTGGGIGVSRSVFEGIIAHLARDPDNLSKQYRLTTMKKQMRLVALNSVSNAPTSTIARLNGSYFRDEGLTSALRRQVDEQQPFENLLRGLPPAVIHQNERTDFS